MGKLRTTLSDEIMAEIDAQYRARFAHFSDALFLLDWRSNDTIVACNDALAQLVGYSREELIGNFYGVISEVGDIPEDPAAEVVDNSFAWHLSQVQNAHGYINLVRKDGHFQFVKHSSWLTTLAGRELIVMIVEPAVAASVEEAPGIDQFQQFFRHSREGAVLIDFSDPCMPIIDCNVAYAEMNGYQRQEIIGHTAFDFSEKQDPERFKQILAEDKTPFINNLRHAGIRYEGRHRRRDGSCYPIQIEQELVLVQGRELVLSKIRDVTEHHSLREDEKLRNRLLDMISRNVPLQQSLSEIANVLEHRIRGSHCAIFQYCDGQLEVGAAPTLPVSYTDTFHRLVSLNGDNILQLLNERQDAVIAPLPDVGLPGQKEDSLRPHMRACWAFPLLKEKELKGVITLYLTEPRGPSVGEMELVRSALQLATTAFQHHWFNERLAYQARHDALTGLLNRIAFQERLEHAITLAERQRNKVAVLFLDLDGFKNVNDSLGHKAGDDVLQEVARRLQKCVRRSDTVARLGGDEFVVLLCHVDKQSAATTVAEKIISSMTMPFTPSTGGHKRECHLTASVGIALYPDNADNSEELIHDADAAMYEVKQSGKNRWSVFQAKLSA